MTAPRSTRPPPSTAKIRRDGWTADRQIGFLMMLLETGRVAEAAAAVGLSRESAYRLRARPGGGLFAALWDRVMNRCAWGGDEIHNSTLTDGRLARLLGTHYRRQSGEFASIGKSVASRDTSDRTRTL
jgi:hypothetical protein